MTPESALPHPLDLAARWLPPAQLLGLPLRLCPAPIQREALERVLNQLLAEMIADGDFDYLEGHRLAVEVSDMGLRWVISAGPGRLQANADSGPADSTIRGNAIEFVLLASRLEDPDTLFFQRRLEVTGDTAIGLTTRNLLDRLPVDELPLPLRIVLNRAGRFAQRVRSQKSKAAPPRLGQAQPADSVRRPSR